MGVDIGWIYVPTGNPGALRSAAKGLLGLADEVDRQVTQVRAAAFPIVPSDWSGNAASTFHVAAAQLAFDMSVAPGALRRAGQAVDTLATELEAAQTETLKMRELAADVQGRSDRLDQQIAEASGAGPEAAPLLVSTLVKQLDYVYLEAASVKSRAEAAVTRYQDAAAAVASVLNEVASMAPSFQRALRRLEVGGAFDPFAALQKGDFNAWYRALWGDTCPTGPGSYGGYGTFIRGPDGLLYPVVVPSLMMDGFVYNGNRGTIVPSEDVHTLGGTDPDWSETYRLEGVGRFKEGPSGLEKFFIAFAMTNPNLHPDTAPFGEGDYAALVMGAGGVPYINTEPRAPKGPSVSPSNARLVSPTAVMVDGELMFVDANADPATTSYNRAIRRQLGPVPPRVMGAQRAVGAASLAASLAEGVNIANSADNYGVAAYQVVFEVNEDGRRRALFRTYQVNVDSMGEYIIDPSHVYLDDEGEIAFDNIGFRQGDEIGPADPPYRVVQFEDEKYDD
jgi:uncharacterized protein YukE